MRALSTLRVRLILVMTAVVAVAIGVVFLYVVPTLRDSLISQRFDRLQKVAKTERRSLTLQKYLAADDRSAYQPILTRIGRLANARVDVYHLDADGKAGADDGRSPRCKPGNAAVRRAAEGTPIVRGRGEDGDLVVAVRMPGSNAVVALSQQVSDVNATADTVERRILIAAVLALAVACAVGWGAAHAVSRRLARLERAATRISIGRVRRADRRPVARRAGRALPGVRHDAGAARAVRPRRARTSSPTPRTSCARRCSRSAGSSSWWTTRTWTSTPGASSCGRCASR